MSLYNKVSTGLSKLLTSEYYYVIDYSREDNEMVYIHFMVGGGQLVGIPIKTLTDYHEFLHKYILGSYVSKILDYISKQIKSDDMIYFSLAAGGSVFPQQFPSFVFKEPAKRHIYINLNPKPDLNHDLKWHSLGNYQQAYRSSVTSESSNKLVFDINFPFPLDDPKIPSTVLYDSINKLCKTVYEHEGKFIFADYLRYPKMVDRKSYLVQNYVNLLLQITRKYGFKYYYWKWACNYVHDISLMTKFVLSDVDQSPQINF